MKKAAYFFIIAIGTILALIYGQNIIIQLIVSLLLWFTAFQLKKAANKFKWFRRFIPSKLQLIVILSLLVFILYLVFIAVGENLSNLLESSSNYEANIAAINKKADELLGVSLEDKIKTILNPKYIKDVLSGIAESLSNFLSQAMMILIYLLFIFLETDNFKLKIDALFPQSLNKKKFIATLENIETSLSRYFRVKTQMGLLIAFLAFIVLYFIGVDAPLLWAFLIFILNYIPTIGPIIATLFTGIFSLLQFGEFFPFIMILLIIGGIQQVVGNFIEPKLMGKHLNISPLVALVSLAVWGEIWGVMGMLLSVPITVIIIIILSQFKQTQKAAILLSEKGNLSLNKQKKQE